MSSSARPYCAVQRPGPDKKLLLRSWQVIQTIAVLAKTMQTAYFASVLSCLVPSIQSAGTRDGTAALERELWPPGYDGMTPKEGRGS
jgi:hypothetical protein